MTLLSLGVLAGCSLPIPPDTPQTTYAIDDLAGPSGSTSFRMDQQELDAAIASAADGTFGDVHSLVVIFDDELVAEEYFQGWNRHKLHPAYSVTKSVTSALVGLTISDALNEPILSILPEYDGVIANPDPRKATITVEDALTMTGGFEWNELDVPITSVGTNDVYALLQDPDPVRFTFDRPIIEDPGTAFRYNTGLSVTLGAVLERKTGLRPEDIAAAQLFPPLGITVWDWGTTPDGRTDTGSGLSLHPVNMAMLGYLYLEQGALDGTQVIPSSWVTSSTTSKVTTGFPGVDYGFQWWRYADPSSLRPAYWPGVDLRADDTFAAEGVGGQLVVVIPHARMVVAVTSFNPANESPSYRLVSKVYDALEPLP